MPNKVVIHIDTNADTRAIERTAQSLDRMKHSAKEAIDTLKLGVGIDIGGRLVESIAELPRILAEAVHEGVAFRQFWENSAIAIGGALKSVEPAKYLNFADAKRDGEAALDELQKKANQLGIDFESLVETFKVNVPTMAHAGITSIQQQVDTIVRLNQVAAAKGISGFQAQRDIIDLLNGMGNRTLLGKELEANGVTNESINRAREQGTLYDHLIEKLGAYSDAGAAAANSLTAAETRLANQLKQTLGDAAEPIFERLKTGMAELNEALKDPETIASLRALGIQIAGVVDDGVKLTEWALKHSDVLITAAKSVGILAVAYAAVKIKDVVLGLSLMTVEFVRGTAAIEAETAAVTANTAARAANNAQRAGGGGFFKGAVAGGVGGTIARLGNAISGAALPLSVGLMAQQAYADSVNNHTDKLAGTSESVSRITQKYTELLGAAKTMADREKIIAGIDSDIVALGEMRNGASAAEARVIDMATALLMKQHEIALDLTEEKMKQRAHEREIAEAKKQQLELDEKLAKYQAERSAQIGQRIHQLHDTEAVDTGDPAKIQQRIDALQKARELKPALTSGTVEEIRARDQEIDSLDERIKTLVAAKKDAEEKQDEKTIQRLKDQISLQEEMGKLRIEQAEAGGASEDDLKRKRLQIEQEVADFRHDAETRIGALQKESDDARQAREVAFQADTLSRANALRDIARSGAPDPERARWERGSTGSGIDARTQRSWDSTGRFITEEQGKATLGRDAMGVPIQPSAFDLMTGPGWNGAPPRTFADLAPQAQRPTASPAKPGGQTPSADAAAATQRAAQALDVNAQKLGQAAGAIEQAAKGLGPAVDRLNGAVRELQAQVDAIGEGR